MWAIDADGLVVRPGPRLVDGVEALAAIFHPGPIGRSPCPPAASAVSRDQRDSAMAADASRSAWSLPIIRAAVLTTAEAIMNTISTQNTHCGQS